ncbi:MAG: hypothetical protein HQL01_00165 [Nitrospirae bacterium]|nr:hypothetical protein [Nitrospirota bacterium]
MSRYKKIQKQALLYAFLVFAVIAFFELSSYLTYKAIYKSWMSFGKLRKERRQYVSTGVAADNKSASAIETVYLLHPYYGYVMNEGDTELFKKYAAKGDRDTYGFYNKYSPVQKRSVDKLLVGITGGSVAMIMAMSYEGVLVKLLSAIPQFRGRQIMLIDLSLGGFKQPQQLFSASDIIAHGGQFDILINIDGFNEIALPAATNIGHGVPFHFPQNWRLLAERMSSKKEELLMLQIEQAKEHRRHISTVFSAWLPSHTATGNLLWRVLNAKDNQKVASYEAMLANIVTAAGVREIRQIRSTQCRTAFLGPEYKHITVRSLYIDIVRHWQRNSVMLNNVIANQGGMYFQFLQPNQYYTGSKPMSAEEAAVAVSAASPYKKEVERGYPYMRAGGAGLQNAGVNFTDLTLIFKHVKFPVYLDACCHFNKEGYDIFIASIVDTIAKTVATSGLSPTHVVPIEKIDNNLDFMLDNLMRYTLDINNYDDGANTPAATPMPPGTAIK